jgi:hypothetical protein
MVTALFSGWEEICWRIIPIDTPRVIRRCPQCNQLRRFVSTGKFRLNAQQRRIDVWLLYRCAACDTTWKHPLFERCTPEEIGAERHERLLRNDAHLAYACAFDLAALRRARADVDAAVPFRVESGKPAPRISNGRWRITLDLPYPCSVRLDHLLAQALNVPRALIHPWAKDGTLIVPEQARRVLRRPVRHGQIVLLRLDGGPPG